MCPVGQATEVQAGVIRQARGVPRRDRALDHVEVGNGKPSVKNRCGPLHVDEQVLITAQKRARQVERSRGEVGRGLRIVGERSDVAPLQVHRRGRRPPGDQPAVAGERQQAVGRSDGRRGQDSAQSGAIRTIAHVRHFDRVGAAERTRAGDREVVDHLHAAVAGPLHNRVVREVRAEAPRTEVETGREQRVRPGVGPHRRQARGLKTGKSQPVFVVRAFVAHLGRMEEKVGDGLEIGVFVRPDVNSSHPGGHDVKSSRVDVPENAAGEQPDRLALLGRVDQHPRREVEVGGGIEHRVEGHASKLDHRENDLAARVVGAIAEAGGERHFHVRLRARRRKRHRAALEVDQRYAVVVGRGRVENDRAPSDKRVARRVQLHAQRARSRVSVVRLSRHEAADAVERGRDDAAAGRVDRRREAEAVQRRADGAEEKVPVEVQHFVGRRRPRVGHDDLAADRTVRVRQGDGEVVGLVNRIELSRRPDVERARIGKKCRKLEEENRVIVDRLEERLAAVGQRHHVSVRVPQGVIKNDRHARRSLRRAQIVPTPDLVTGVYLETVLARNRLHGVGARSDRLRRGSLPSRSPPNAARRTPTERRRSRTATAPR